MSSKFRSKIWDPILIISQIVSMQFQFYSTLLFLNYLSSKFLAFTVSNDSSSAQQYQYSLDQIFDHRLMNFKSVNNTFLCFTFLANALLSSLFEWKLINRSKQCLDFTVTVFFYHILMCWIYVGSFPSGVLFWILVVISAAAMTIISEYLCMQSALKEIPLSLVPKANL